MAEATDEKYLELVQKNLRLVSISLPHLSGLVRVVEVLFTNKVPSAGIFASGRLLINPDWFFDLSLQDRTFVVAHELLHLALQTHSRAMGSDSTLFNIAHDYIINDMLVKALGQSIPAGGLSMPDASSLSAEAIVLELKKKQEAAESIEIYSWQSTNQKCKQSSAEIPNNPMAKALQKALGQPEPDIETQPSLEIEILDVLPSELEKEWFPDTSQQHLNVRQEKIEQLAAQAASLGVLQNTVTDKYGNVLKLLKDHDLSFIGTESGNSEVMIETLHNIYCPPWELALQQWMENIAPGPRSYFRPSRRTGDRSDLILPGRKREGWILHIVLDTSGSMSSEFPRILGAIATFCHSVNVGQIHVLQCDTDVTKDEMLTPEQLNNYTIAGLGGSDLSAAMYLLAQDWEVESAIVITDGYISYPRQSMPYQVLWVLTEDYSGFSPSYGTIIRL